MVPVDPWPFYEQLVTDHYAEPHGFIPYPHDQFVYLTHITVITATNVYNLYSLHPFHYATHIR
jgi:hypothetical protein